MDSASQHAALGAERRHLTILFCDMVASTEYAYRLDPEDFRQLIESYLSSCAAVVEAHRGRVASYIGDAIVAYFGYPIAYEDDAERAICAGIEILQVVSGLAEVQGQPVQVRVGIASGQSVVGHFSGAPAGVSLVAFGHPVHLAQRLQAVAEPGTILVDEATRQAATGAIEFADRGEAALKGFAEPVRTFAPVRVRDLDSRFARRTRLSKLCGRDREMDVLMDAWQCVRREGRGGAVVVAGEAGIGKSRLLHELRQRAPEASHLMFQCSERGETSPLLPFLTELVRQAQVEPHDPPSLKRAKLGRILSVSETPVETSGSLFARLLSIPVIDGSGEDMADASSERHRAISKGVLVDWIRNTALAKPLLVLVEDLQWADPTSREVVAALLAALETMPALLLVTVRTGDGPPLPELEGIPILRLGRLGEAEAIEIIRDLSPAGPPPDEVVDFVLARAEGVPLFVEEFARDALDRGITSAPDQKGAPRRQDIPNSLQSILLARLDRLGPAKELAQIAATIGREFEVGLLVAVSGFEEAAVRTELSTLMRTALIVAVDGAGGEMFAFKHALLQRAAGDTVLRWRKHKLHEDIAVAMARVTGEGRPAHPERIAYHFEEAGLWEQAAEYWLQAGLRASRTWTKVEAAQMYRRGIEALSKLPDTPERDRKLLRLELEHGDVLYAAFGYVTGEGSAAYHRAIQLSEKVGDPDAPVRALDGLFGTHFNSGQFADAIGAADRLIELGESCGDLKPLVIGLQFKGMSLFCRGQLTSALLYLDRALAHEDAAERVGSDFPSMAMIYRAWTLHILGRHAEALASFNAALAIVRRQQPYRLAACLGNGCILFAFRKETQAISSLVTELVPLARDHGFKLWRKFGEFFAGWVKADRDGSPDGTQLMRSTLDSLEDQQVDKSCYYGLMAQAYLRTGELNEAFDMVRQGINHSNKIGEHYYTAELFRIRGEVEMRRGMLDAAESSLREAITFAQGQAAASWEENARRSLEQLTIGR